MTTISVEQQAMVALFQRHVQAELAGDLAATLATMTDDPHLNHVPKMAGGVGRQGVQAFYRDHLVGKFFPPDVTMTNISRTLGQDQLVDEIAISFTHTQPIDWLLPGVPVTGKRVEMGVAGLLDLGTVRFRMNISIGIRPACWCRSGCSIRPVCRLAVPKSPAR
jgi:carboxymethylenebutenolidase